MSRNYSDQRGLRNRNAYHPDSVVQKARAMYRPGVFGYQRIANALGVKKSTVVQWINGMMRSDAWPGCSSWA